MVHTTPSLREADCQIRGSHCQVTVMQLTLRLRVVLPIRTPRGCDTRTRLSCLRLSVWEQTRILVIGQQQRRAQGMRCEVASRTRRVVSTIRQLPDRFKEVCSHNRA